jgi:hypothetical protein
LFVRGPVDDENATRFEKVFWNRREDARRPAPLCFFIERLAKATIVAV